MKTHLGGAVVAVALGASVVSVHADGLDEKRCIVASAAKVPLIQGLVFNASTAESLDKGAAAKWVLSTVVTRNDAIAVANAFGTLDDKTEQALKRAYGADEYASALSENVARNLDAGYTVKLSVTAASQSFTLRYGCIKTSYADLYVKPMGLSD